MIQQIENPGRSIRKQFYRFYDRGRVQVIYQRRAGRFVPGEPDRFMQLTRLDVSNQTRKRTGGGFGPGVLR